MIIDELDDIKCEECYRCAIEDIAAFAIDPENLARLDPEGEMTQYLRKLLDMPNGTLEEASPRPRKQGQRPRRDPPKLKA